MELDDLTIVVSAQDLIRVALGEPELDIRATFKAGDLHVLRECVLENGDVKYTGGGTKGTRPFLSIVVQDQPFIIATSGRFDYARLHYAENAAYIRENRAALSPLDLVEGLRHPGSLEKSASLGSVLRYGRKLVPRPYVGAAILMEPAASVKFHWMTVDDTFRAELEPDIDAVFEIACGAGHALFKLALGYERNIPFFGGEIARHGRACLQELAEAAGLENIHPVTFDLENPDFSFLKGYRRVLFLGHAAIAYGKNGLREMWDRLFTTVPAVKGCLFEMMSYAMPELTAEPLFSQKRALAYGYDLSIYPEFLRRVAAGEIVLDEVVPDISGPSIHSSVSLIRFHTPS